MPYVQLLYQLSYYCLYLFLLLGISYVILDIGDRENTLLEFGFYVLFPYPVFELLCSKTVSTALFSIRFFFWVLYIIIWVLCRRKHPFILFLFFVLFYFYFYFYLFYLLNSSFAPGDNWWLNRWKHFFIRINLPLSISKIPVSAVFVKVLWMLIMWVGVLSYTMFVIRWKITNSMTSENVELNFCLTCW